MLIKNKKLPWAKQRTTSSPDKYYHSNEWKSIRTRFRQAYTTVQGRQLQNIYCVECYKQTGKHIEGKYLDHIIQKKLGGTEEHSNLQTLCDKHHNSKSAKEGNAMRIK